jgi:hypothetical protein
MSEYTLPSWLVPVDTSDTLVEDDYRPPVIQMSPEHIANKRAIMLMRFDVAFERGIEMMLDTGTDLPTLVRENWPDVPPGRLIQWIQKDPERTRRYEEACSVTAELMSHDLVRISDGIGPTGDPVLEDVDRSKLKFQARTKVMSYWNKRKFGDTRQIEQTVLTSSPGDAATIDEMRQYLQRRMGQYDSAIESLRNAGFVFDEESGNLLGKEINGVIVALEKLS